MKTEQDETAGKKCFKEHLSCGNFNTDGTSVLECIEIKSGESLVWEVVDRHSICFALSGEMDISTGEAVSQRVAGGQFFVVSAGDIFYAEAVTDVCLMRCDFSSDMALCNHFHLEQLRMHLPYASKAERGRIVLLPIRELLLKELEIMRLLVQMGMKCGHFLSLKREMLLIELRVSYPKEDLAALFAPVLGVDNAFRASVLKSYRQVQTVQELMELQNMSSSTFKRKFRKEFGMPAKKWLVHKKEQLLIRDILMTNLTVLELADKYVLTPNYMTSFCRRRFGKTPTEIRADYANFIPPPSSS